MAEIEPITYSNKGPLWARVLVMMLEYMTGRIWMEYTYDKCMKSHDKDVAQKPEFPFFSTSLRELKVKAEVKGGSLENIPAEGPIVVVANHPFGIIDGLLLNQLMYDRRKDYYILTNQVLLKAERMVPYLIPIDDSETKEGTAINKTSILKSMKHLRNGGAICVFPAGRLARPKGWKAPFEDLEWQELTAHFVKNVKAAETGETPTIVPIFFEGENSRLFRIAAMLKFFTITRSLVIHECMNKVGKTIGVHIGKPIKPADIPKDLTHLDLAAWMREQTLALPKMFKKKTDLGKGSEV